MVIVYLSLALAVLAIIWFIIMAIGELKGLKKTVVKVSKIQEKIRESTEQIVKEKESLDHHIETIQEDVQDKKLAVKTTILEAKGLQVSVIEAVHEGKEQIRSLKQSV